MHQDEGKLIYFIVQMFNMGTCSYTAHIQYREIEILSSSIMLINSGKSLGTSKT